MSRTDRILAFAAIASVLLHLMALVFTPRFDLFQVSADEMSAPLEARIVLRKPMQVAPAPPVAKPARAQTDTVKKRPAPPPERIARARKDPPPAPHWIARPDDLGAVPPLPDGDLAGVAASMQASGATGSESGSRDAAAGGSTTVAEDAATYPVHRARLVYDLSYAGGPVGTVTHTWFTDGHSYRIESVAEGAGLIKLFYAGKFVQRSTGRLGPEGLVPIEYTLQRGSAARSESARFDWRASQLSLAWKNEHRVVDLPAGTQDALSIVHQAYFMPPTASSAPLEVATSRKLAQYSFELIGETLIETPIGIVRAVRVRRTDDDGMRIDAWLDLDRSLLPVRIHGVDRRGFAFEQMIREALVEE